VAVTEPTSLLDQRAYVDDWLELEYVRLGL